MGGVPATEPRINRWSGLIWGPSGWGKTTLACTMPGKRKALLNFDPDGPSSIRGFPNVDVFDFSGLGSDLVLKLKDEDPLDIKKACKVYDGFIVDSMSTITERTLKRGIVETKGATISRPSPGAYGARNNLALEFVRNVLQITALENKHVCFIAHEKGVQTDDEGNVLGIVMALGGDLPNGMSIRINECWPVFEDGKNRKMIICRKSRMREPAKSRMFDTRATTEFEWHFNPMDFDDPKNMRIEDWYNDWEAQGTGKIPLPKPKG